MYKLIPLIQYSTNVTMHCKSETHFRALTCNNNLINIDLFKYSDITRPVF